MIVDYRGGDVSHEELSELSSISSMVDIKPIKNPKSPDVSLYVYYSRGKIKIS